MILNPRGLWRHKVTHAPVNTPLPQESEKRKGLDAPSEKSEAGSYVSEVSDVDRIDVHGVEGTGVGNVGGRRYPDLSADPQVPQQAGNLPGKIKWYAPPVKPLTRGPSRAMEINRERINLPNFSLILKSP